MREIWAERGTKGGEWAEENRTGFGEWGGGGGAEKKTKRELELLAASGIISIESHFVHGLSLSPSFSPIFCCCPP